MIRSLNLKELGSRIEALDLLLLTLVAHRMTLSLSVGAYKKANGEKIYRRDAEKKRLDTARHIAVNSGLDDNFAHALLYLIIDESCKQQMIQLQGDYQLTDLKDEQERYANLRQNLLRLTEAVAPGYDQSYDSKSFSIRSCRQFEQECIDGAISGLQDRSLAIDLGCATGMQTLQLAQKFDRTIGYDLSPEMVKVARGKIGGEHSAALEFCQHDLDEDGIPLPDESVSFVLMNLGTASDIRNIQKLIGEISRVLKRGGRYLLSFYNKDALVYKWDFLPWPDGLAAEINRPLSCLDVRVGNTTYSVFAKSYTSEEVREMLGRTLARNLDIATFPTVSALLPSQLFGKNEQKAREAVDELDRQLSTLANGAYIIATGEKA